jgi:hypothetical protein
VAPFGPDSLVRLLVNDALSPAASILPPAVQDALANVRDSLAGVANGLLGLLPDPTAGFDELPSAYFGLPPSIYQAVNDLGDLAQFGIGQAALDAANWSGTIVPPLVVSNLQAAIADPSNIPGLLSAFAYALVNPAPSATYSLPSLYSSFTPIVQELIGSAAAPIGGPTGLIATTAKAINSILTDALGLLPHPIVDLPMTPTQVKAAGSTVDGTQESGQDSVARTALAPARVGKPAAGPAEVPTLKPVIQLNVAGSANTLGHLPRKAEQTTNTDVGSSSSSTPAGKSGGGKSGSHTGRHAKTG